MQNLSQNDNDRRVRERRHQITAETLASSSFQVATTSRPIQILSSQTCHLPELHVVAKWVHVSELYPVLSLNRQRPNRQDLTKPTIPAVHSLFEGYPKGITALRNRRSQVRILPGVLTSPCFARACVVSGRGTSGRKSESSKTLKSIPLSGLDLLPETKAASAFGSTATDSMAGGRGLPDVPAGVCTFH
jgi:hypothetical protein